MEYIFREYRPKDKSQIENILISKEYLRKYTANKAKDKFFKYSGLYRNNLFVLEDLTNRNIAGVILLRKKPDQYFRLLDWWVYGVYISQRYRGKGLGEMLLTRAIAKLQSLKVRRVYLFVACDNDIAIDLYKKSGFKIIESIHTIHLKKMKISKSNINGMNFTARKTNLKTFLHGFEFYKNCKISPLLPFLKKIAKILNLYNVETYEYSCRGSSKNVHFFLSKTRILKEIYIDLYPQGQRLTGDMEKMITMVSSEIPAVPEVRVRFDSSKYGYFLLPGIYIKYSDSQYIMARSITNKECSGPIK